MFKGVKVRPFPTMMAAEYSGLPVAVVVVLGPVLYCGFSRSQIPSDRGVWSYTGDVVCHSDAHARLSYIARTSETAPSTPTQPPTTLTIELTRPSHGGWAFLNTRQVERPSQNSHSIHDGQTTYSVSTPVPLNI